jgi:hypothetical protein
MEEIISFASSKYSVCEIFKVLHIIMLGKKLEVRLLKFLEGQVARVHHFLSVFSIFMFFSMFSIF